MQFREFMHLLSGPVLLVVTLSLLSQGQLFLACVTGWLSYDSLSNNAWVRAKLGALLDNLKGTKP